MTHASDNFQRLYDLAVQLILSGNAYVDHQKPSDIQGVNVGYSQWRDRPVEESIKLFKDMKCGMIEEEKATLRMKVSNVCLCLVVCLFSCLFVYLFSS